MAGLDAFRGDIKIGATDVSLDVVLLDAITGGFKTGVAHTNIVVSYWRQGGTPGQSVSLSALASITSVHSDGGWKEAHSTLHPGSYRLDLPDAIFATGANWGEVMVTGAGILPYKREFSLDILGVAASGVVSASFGAASITSASFDTDALSAAAISAAGANKVADALLSRTLGAEAYAADGAVPVLKEILYMLWSRLAQFDQSGTTLTSRKLNGTDASMTFTFNAASNPTSVSRSS